MFEHNEKFMKMLKDNQTLVLEGETGSGKTTQVRWHCMFLSCPCVWVAYLLQHCVITATLEIQPMYSFSLFDVV